MKHSGPKQNFPDSLDTLATSARRIGTPQCFRDAAMYAVPRARHPELAPLRAMGLARSRPASLGQRYRRIYAEPNVPTCPQRSPLTRPQSVDFDSVSTFVVNAAIYPNRRFSQSPGTGRIAASCLMPVTECEFMN
ncbi:hypothetical protein Mal65_02830 [Crateriforma conspicua]|nr:hypothetical protein Mal65_02830 [Crateriforma conspicua]